MRWNSTAWAEEAKRVLESLRTENTTRAPQLPLPSLEDTMQRWEESVVAACDPLHPETEGKLASFREEARVFVEGIGRKAHAELEKERAEERADYNHMADRWERMYLATPDPLPVHISPYFVCGWEPEGSQGEAAAATAVGVIDWWKAQVVGKGSQWEEAREKGLDTSAWAKVLGYARLPSPPSGERVDVARVYDPVADGASLGVLAQGRMYVVQDVIHPETGERVDQTALAATLEAIMEDARVEDKAGPELGMFTALDRPSWGRVRAQVVEEGVDLDAWDGSLFVIALDDVPLSDRSLLVGGEAGVLNRWYDKMQLVAGVDGRVGFVFEHTYVDGVVWRGMVEWMSAGGGGGGGGCGGGAENGSRILEFKEVGVDNSAVADSEHDDVVGIVRRSQNNVSLDTRMLEEATPETFKNLGVSADAVIQVCAMRAFDAMSPTPQSPLRPAVYEALSMQSYWQGRTETIRSRTQAMEAALAAWPDERMLRRAADAHRELITTAVRGGGVDRHLYVLGDIIASRLGEKTEDTVLGHELARHSSRWQISTSNVSSRGGIRSFGFGPVDPHGVGFGYNLTPSGLYLTATSFTSSPLTSSSSFLSHLSQSLLQSLSIFQPAARDPDHTRQ